MSTLRRSPRLIVTTLAVIYLALACLHTVGDFDAGWQLATGRYLWQHHAVPSTDVLSYTSPSVPWHYPSFGGALLYVIFHQFGYGGLSCFCALAAAALAIYLLRRAALPANLASGILLLLAAPLLSYRLTPRGDLFTTVLFAIFLAEVWRFHRNQPARLWLLPGLMLLWVNVHPGFIAGVALLLAYLVCELLLLPFAEVRSAARQRLSAAWPWLAATAVAALANPWGTGAFRQAWQLAGLGSGGHSTRVIGELARQPLSWHFVQQAIQLRDPESGLWWLLLAAFLATLCAIRRREFGAATLQLIAMAAGIERVRFQGLSSILVIVVGGDLLTRVFAGLDFYKRPARPEQEDANSSWSLHIGIALAVILCALTLLRVVDLASNRTYFALASTSNFGIGESWWFPERAAAYIEREHLPGNIFQPYNLGGFTALRLGPRYLDYIDGRKVSGEVADEEQELLSQSPDSEFWMQVASRRNINMIFLPLARYAALGGFDLNAFCEAKQWQPVYMDEVSLVLLRRSPQNKPWLEHLAIDCQAVRFPPPAQGSLADLYNFYANSGAVLYTLARDQEAEAAWRHAARLEPEDPNIHLLLAELYWQKHRLGEAEREARTSLALRQTAGEWYEFGQILSGQGRDAEAEYALAAAAAMSPAPAGFYLALGQVELKRGEPDRALASFAKAERKGPSPGALIRYARDFRIQLDENRARAYLDLHNPQQASAYAQDAVRLAPSSPHWALLADCYAALGRSGDAEQARQNSLHLPAK